KDVIDGKYIKTEDHKKEVEKAVKVKEDELQKKNKELQKKLDDQPYWKSQYDTLTLNVEDRIKAELEKAAIECDTRLKEQANNNLLEHEQELNKLRERIDELEQREPTREVETPLTDRFKGK